MRKVQRVVHEDVAVAASGTGRVPGDHVDRSGPMEAGRDTAVAYAAERAAWNAGGGFAEWDRAQWVGDGQEPPGLPLPERMLAIRRWTKWEWVGEGQGEPGPRRGLPAAGMDDAGSAGPSGHCHNPGVAFWAGPARRMARA